MRTRNQELLKKCDIVVDVGGEYDLAKWVLIMGYS